MFIDQNFTNPVSNALIILHKTVSLSSTQEFKLLQDIDDCFPSQKEVPTLISLASVKNSFCTFLVRPPIASHRHHSKSTLI